MSKEQSKTLLQKKCQPLDEKPFRLFYLQSLNPNGESTLSTNTYFNRFAAAHWAQVPGLKNLELKFATHFDGYVEIKGATLEGEFLMKRFVVRKGGAYGKEFQPHGVLSVWIECVSQQNLDQDSLDFEYHSSSLAYIESKTTIVICTYNKPIFVQRNLDSFVKNFDSQFIEQILVIDQGNENVTPPAHPSIKIITQANLGGSGGFARGINEFLKSNSSGIVLMDDDIVFIPEIIYRILRFASLGQNAFAISTQMLNLYKPEQIWADQEIIDMDELWGAPDGRKLFDANSLPEILPRGNMVAWWCGYFPRAFVERAGLPFPMFIHWDDIDYSLRLSQNINFTVLTVFGFGVWHEPFDSKSQWGWISYFDIRNVLIGASIHDASFLSCYRKSLRVLLISIMSHRYQANAAIRAGIIDFINGPKCIRRDQRAWAINAFNSIASKKIVCDSNSRVSLRTLGLMRRFHSIFYFLATLFNLPQSSKTSAWTTHNFSSARAISRTDHLLVFSPYGGIAEELLYDSVLSRKTSIASIKLMLELLVYWRRAKREWKKSFEYLVSQESWSEFWSDDH
jgi:GT2 family glycosyltransferase